METILSLDPSLALTEEHRPSVDFLISEALDLVDGYTGMDFRELDEIPAPVVRVVQRVVVRSLLQGTADIPFGATSRQDTAGPFNRSTSFESGSTSGGVWLTRQDKTRLRRWAGGDAGTVMMW